MRTQHTGLRQLSCLWLFCSVLGLGLQSEAALPNLERAKAPRHVNVLLRVYLPEDADLSHYDSLSVDAIDGVLDLAPAQIPRRARLALVGWDQTDATLRQALQNVVLVGRAEDTWALPSLDPNRGVPEIAINDALDVPLPREGLQLTILFDPDERLIFDEERAPLQEFDAIRVDDLRANDEGHPLLPLIVRMSQPASVSAHRWQLSLDRMRQQPVTGVGVLIHHSDYGTAALDAHDYLLYAREVQVPLIYQGTLAAERAFTGWVVDRAGQQPLEGAVVRCDHVRTPGEGLIDVARGHVLTDAEGHFCLYPVARTNRADQRGTLVPAHSRAALSISNDRSSDLLPEIQDVYNDEPTVVALHPGDAFHTFAFIRAGQRLDADQINRVNLYYTLPDQPPSRHVLPRRYLTEGGKIAYGTYIASVGPDADGLRFEPLVVDERSPRELVFTPLAGAVYRGRVLHGITDLPFASGFVLAYTGTAGDRRLSTLMDQDWQVIDRFDEDHAHQKVAFEALGKVYVFQNMVRTDDRGYYRLALDPGRETHSLLFFARDFVPFKVPVRPLASDDGSPIDVPDVKLFPAACVTVTPQAEPGHDGHVSVRPLWVIDANENPLWAVKMIPWVNWERQREGQFEYDPWLKLDRSNRIYVPAQVALNLRLEVSYATELCSLTVPTNIYLDQGQEVDLGTRTLPAAQRYVVRVLDAGGNPVEGLPLRQEFKPKHFGVAHNTDENGDAYFYAPPNSIVSIHITAHDLGQAMLPDGQHHLTWNFELGAAQDELPRFELPVPADLIRTFRTHGPRPN